MKLFLVISLYIVAVACDISLISSEEAVVIKSTWSKVKNNEIDILYTIFKDNPDIQARFPAFAGRELEKVTRGVPFALHATRIISFLTEIVRLTGNPEYFSATKTLINELGVSHRKRGISKEQFNEFRASLVNYIKNHTVWDDNVAVIWNKALDNFYTILSQALDGTPMN